MKIRNLFRALIVGAVFSLPAQGDTLAPDFKTRDINGNLYTLSDHRGEIIVLNFWATWCNPCIAELPYLDSIDKMFSEQDVEVIAVSIDGARHASRVKSYVKSRKYGFTVLHDKSTEIVPQYNPSMTIPYTVVIDRKGNIVYTHSGYSPGDEHIYINLIKDMLKNEAR